MTSSKKMLKPLPCPSGCPTEHNGHELPFVMVNEDQKHFFVTCSCGWKTAVYLTRESAIKAWNNRKTLQSAGVSVSDIENIIKSRVNHIWIDDCKEVNEYRFKMENLSKLAQAIHAKLAERTA